MAHEGNACYDYKMNTVDTLDALKAAKGFKLVHLNVRSLVKKMDQIRLMLNNSHIDVITFSETWLKPHLHTKLVELTGYEPVRLDRNTKSGKHVKKKGGGLITYVKQNHASDLESLDALNISNEYMEAQWVYIHRPSCKNVIVCNMYRPPTGDLSKAIVYLDNSLKSFNLSKTDIFLLGDMNVNYKNKKSPAYKKLQFFAKSNGLTQCIDTTTRVTEKTKSIIDLILTNSKFIRSSGSLEHHISDHQPIYIIHKKSRDTRPTAEFKGRSYRNFDKIIFQEKLTEVNWADFYNIEDVSEAWQFLLNHINTILDQMCPIRSFKIRNYRPDWMTRELIEQIKDRDYFYKRAKKTGDSDLWNIAKYLRNSTNASIRQAKRDFVLNELKQNENNAKKFWKTIRSVLPTGKENLNNEIMLKDGDEKLNRNKVAAFINDFFINVGKLDTDLDLSTNIPIVCAATESDLPPLSLLEVSEHEVCRVVKSINISKSSGLDNINSLVIKEAFTFLKPEITYMYNLSIRTAKFPDTWKRALVVPIPKKGNLTKVQNYRPISLLPLPGKIMEKLVHQLLSSYLENNSLLAKVQHGFRRDHSTVHSIAQLTNYVNRKMDNRLLTLAVFIDFKKAFDCVQHPVLLKKLRALNLDESVTNWIKDYLTQRQQRVYANDTYSSYQNISQGVPQGSVLGPLFYIIYANDLSNIVKNCEIALYADDTVLYTSSKNFDVSVNKLQEDIDSLSHWCKENGIMANTDKTKIMFFGSNNSLAKVPPFEIKFGDVPLQTVTSYTYLGISLDNSLTYNLYVNRIISSVTSKLKQFRRMRGFLNTKAALMVYKGMLLPILEYGDIFLVGASATNIKRLQILQNKGLRCALNRDTDTSIVDLHKSAKLSRLKFRREQHVLNYMYDYAQNEENHKANSKVSVKTRSSKKLLLKCKRPHTEKFKKSLAYVGIKKWNGLSEGFHHTQSKMKYKSMVAEWVSKKATIGNNLDSTLLLI